MDKSDDNDWLQAAFNADALFDEDQQLVKDADEIDENQQTTRSADNQEAQNQQGLADQAFNDPEFQSMFQQLSDNDDSLDWNQFQEIFDLIEQDSIAKRKPEDELESPPKRQHGQFGGANKLYSITKTTTSRTPKFGLTQHIYALDLHIDKDKTFNQAMHDFSQLFEQLYRDFVRNIRDTDMVRLIFMHDLFTGPISFPFVHPTEITPEDIMTRFDQIVQSYKLNNEKVQERYNFTCDVMVKEMPNGGGKRICKEKKAITDFTSFLHNHRSVKIVKNHDELCLLRAIILAVEFEKKSPTFKNLVARQDNKEFNKLLLDMMTATGISKGPCGIPAVKAIEAYLQDYQIMIIDENGRDSDQALYLNKDREFTKFIYLCLHENHYYAITSMEVFTGRDYYCHHCKIGFKHLGRHRCQHTCQSCERLNCQPITYQEKKCTYCKANCYNETCMRIHNEKVCKNVTMCKECNRRKNPLHVCGDNAKWCPNCKKSVSLDHKCYILTEAQKEERDRGVHKPKFAGYIFFDYEAYSNAEGFHVPNLVIAKRVCADCLDKETRCQECQQTHKFDTNEEFCEWLLQQEHYTALAHNLKGYDGVFIANYCIKHLTSAESFPELIATPTKLLQIKFRRVKIIDSYSFLPMGLDKFSKTFALQELKKGFFPHAFNKPENATYDDRYPDKSFYGSEFFSISKKAEFDEFYAANKDKMFNFQQELVDYCISDVNLLMEGCLRFRRIIIDSTKRNNEDSGVDPFRVAITMASLCNYIYRRNYMPQDTIAIIPDNGYNPRLMSSKKAQRWLDFQAEKDKVFIQTASNGGEKKVGNYQLDGFCEENKTIYEFNGCYWHGCQKCYSYSTWNSTRNMTMGHINNLTKARREHITSKFPDYKFVEKWECEFDTEIATDMTIQKFIKLNPISEQLKPRDALFGGRTNAFLLYYKAKANEKIKYYDFTSLYPTVQKYELYPAGHPEIITSNFGDYAPGKYFGLVKCSVLPPRRLYFPLLPARINKKLVFTLCSM